MFTWRNVFRIEKCIEKCQKCSRGIFSYSKIFEEQIWDHFLKQFFMLIQPCVFFQLLSFWSFYNHLICISLIISNIMKNREDNFVNKQILDLENSSSFKVYQPSRVVKSSIYCFPTQAVVWVQTLLRREQNIMKILDLENSSSFWVSSI